MSKQVVRLCRLQLANLFGKNEFRYTKDKAKKKRMMGLGIIWIMLILMVIGYVGALSAGLGMLGMAEIVPMYLYAIASLLMLVLTFFKAGSILFSMKGYEVLVALPVSKTAIVLSRFLSMYVTNLLGGLLIMLPGIVVYGYFERPGIGCYLLALTGTLFLPLFPLTIASVIGAGITAVSARVKHKSLVETMLMLVFIVVATGGSVLFGKSAEQMNISEWKNMAEIVSAQIGTMYPPAQWFGNALLGNLGDFVLLLAVPTVIFAVFIGILQKYFQSICTALNAVNAKNNYKMQKLYSSTKVVALWKKELKRYFASGVYVTNTIVGYVLALLVSASIFFLGMETIVAAADIPNLDVMIKHGLPFVIVILMSIATLTSCSISMEGNTFWQIQTLPVRSKDVYDSKILLNLTVAAPFYVLSVMFLALAIKPDFLELMWLIVIPGCYLVFMSVMGITVNLAFPVMKWESEVRVVKQSASTLIMMLLSMVCCIIPMAGVIIAGEKPADFIRLLTVAVIVGFTAFLYRKNNKKELMDIIS